MFKFTSHFFLILFVLLGSKPSLAQQDDKKTANNFLHEAISLMQNGNPDEAITLLEKASELDPQNDYPYRYETALAYYYKQDYSKTIRMLTELSEHPQCTESLYQALGNAYDLAGKPRKALKTYEVGLGHFPESGDLYREKAFVLFSQGKATQALACAERAIQLNPQYPSNYFTAASLC